MAGGGTRYNPGVIQETQDTEIMEYLSTEPNRPRFAWFETKAVQRPEIGVSAVSEVRSPPLTPFEIKRNSGAQIGLSGVRNMIVAEGKDSSTNSLEVCPTARQNAFVLLSKSSPPQKFSVQGKEA